VDGVGQHGRPADRQVTSDGRHGSPSPE
jgi:hypothetical protein